MQVYMCLGFCCCVLVCLQYDHVRSVHMLVVVLWPFQELTGQGTCDTRMHGLRPDMMQVMRAGSDRASHSG